MKKIKSVGLTLGILIVVIGQGFSQTNLHFTSANATDENAIQLYWTSTNHELYTIQFADALGTNANGSTTWNTLYHDYPSHGTNTFVGDFGNYDALPMIPHPKNKSKRFYRILDQGADSDIADTPIITITSPTNGDVLSGQITVSVSVTSSNLPVVTTKLYVDGQEMDESDDGTNYVINTCEWPNGSHTLFAVATARSGFAGPTGNFAVSTSHGVSSYTQVTFNNLISRIAFSQPFFEPSLGQTQEVTATFAANCDWTFQIQDENSNTVRNASGGGNFMTFDWDGTGDGETNIPDGVYYYYISAQTNGESSDSMMSESMASSSFTSDDSSQWYVTPIDGSGGITPLALYPPGTIDTNNYYVFQASPSDVRPQRSSSMTMRSSFSANDSSSSSDSAPSQNSAAAPQRPPTSPMKNSVGTYGVAYFTWSSPQTVAIPKNNALGVCHLDGGSGSQIGPYTNIPEGDAFAQNYARVMSKAGWKVSYLRSDSNLHAQNMRRSDQGYGGGELFTTAEIGLFMDHGDYGTDPDYSAGSSGSKQAYFRCSSDSGDDGWLRMCQIGFGGSLKWMGILACNSLNTFTSMKNAGAIPLKTTHMVCGGATDVAVGDDIGGYWAHNMLGSFFHSPEKIRNAWYDAGREQYAGATGLGTTVFRVACYPECLDDTVQNNTDPTSPSSAPGNLIKDDAQVYP